MVPNEQCEDSDGVPVVSTVALNLLKPTGLGVQFLPLLCMYGDCMFSCFPLNALVSSKDMSLAVCSVCSVYVIVLSCDKLVPQPGCPSPYTASPLG